LPSFLFVQKKVYCEYSTEDGRLYMDTSKKKKSKQKSNKKQNKSIVIASVLLVAAMVVCAGICIKLAISLFDKQNFEDVVNEQESTTEVEDVMIEQAGTVLEEALEEPELPVITPEIMEEPESIQITISAAGDCTLGTDENFDRETSFNAKYNEVGYAGFFFENVRSIFEVDDLTIVNLEGPLTTNSERADKVYAFKGKPEFTQVLIEGSVEAANLANNHAFDYGEDGYEDTKKYLSEAEIASFGYDRNAIIDIKGVKVALVGIHEIYQGLECASLLRDNIASVKEEGAQLIIVSFHWGTEKEHYPDSIQKELAHIAVDEGAHLVLGHHPHVLQGIEVYKGRNIVYSLGNFCFGGNKNPSDKDTMIFQQTFTITEGVVAEDNVNKVIPCSLSSKSSYNNYQPMVLDGEERDRVMKRIETYSEGLSS